MHLATSRRAAASIRMGLSECSGLWRLMNWSEGEGWTRVRHALAAALGERYRIDALVDQGGMGAVFRGVDHKHGRTVAIKAIHPELVRDESGRFEREIRIMAGLQHPNILPLLDSGVANDIHFYIMPFVQGETLKTRLDRTGRLPAEEAVRIALEIADGLSHAHGRGILHRDIKPGNVLIVEDRVQLIDFGIARAMLDDGLKTVTGRGSGIGTPNYMAPEQLYGEATPRSDVFSLGAVLYEMLTARVWRHESKGGQPSWTDVPPELVPVAAKALEVAEPARWSAPAEFADALRAWERGDDATAVRESHGGRPGAWRRLRRLLGFAPQELPDDKSIAVLPFRNMRRDEEAEYFSDGITDDVIGHLSRIRELKVISRTSVMRYQDSDLSIPKIARELGVASVLEGSVRRAGDRVRVVCSLIEASSDRPLWSETFDRNLTDIFEIQSEVAQAIADALRAQITDTERSLIRRRSTADAEIHDAYLKGRHLWRRRTRVALQDAESAFTRAIARDPLFAPAYAGLADVYLLEAAYRYRPELEALGKARATVQRALELDDGLAEAHASLAQVLRADRDWEAEEKAYLRAIELNPNYATARQWYATLLAALDRPEEAGRQMDYAIELDPLSHAIAVTCARIRFMFGDHEGAVASCERALELAPRFFSAHAWLSVICSDIGQHDRALAAWDRLRELHPDTRVGAASQAWVLAGAGREEEARAIADAAGEMSGLIYARLGERDEAFHRLEQALSDPSWRLFSLERTLLFNIKIGPWFDPLRDDPRFERLLKLMNMADG